MADDWATYQFGAIRIRTLSDLLDAISACTSAGLGENTVAGMRHTAFMRSAASMLSIQAGMLSRRKRPRLSRRCSKTVDSIANSRGSSNRD